MTAVTAELVVAKNEASKAELRLELAQAVSGFHAAIKELGAEQTAALKELGAEFRIAIEKQNAAIEKQNAAIEKQNAAIEKQNAVIKEQGAEFTAALAKHCAALDRRLTTSTYWMFGGIAAGYLALLGAVIAVLGQLAST